MEELMKALIDGNSVKKETKCLKDDVMCFLEMITEEIVQNVAFLNCLREKWAPEDQEEDQESFYSNVEKISQDGEGDNDKVKNKSSINPVTKYPTAFAVLREEGFLGKEKVHSRELPESMCNPFGP